MPDAPQTNRPPKVIAVISKPGRPELAGVLPKLVTWCAEHGYAVVTDRETGRSRGFGFVELGSDQEARTAIDAMNGAVLDGRRRDRMNRACANSQHAP